MSLSYVELRYSFLRVCVNALSGVLAFVMTRLGSFAFRSVAKCAETLNLLYIL